MFTFAVIATLACAAVPLSIFIRMLVTVGAVRAPIRTGMARLRAVPESRTDIYAGSDETE